MTPHWSSKTKYQNETQSQVGPFVNSLTHSELYTISALLTCCNMSYSIFTETMNNELRLVLIGVTSYDIQGTANEIMGKTVFPDIRSTTEFHHSDLIEGYTGKRVHLTVAPGFMDNRASKSPWQMKRDIQYELQKIDYEKGFHGAIMVMW